MSDPRTPDRDDNFLHTRPLIEEYDIPFLEGHLSVYDRHGFAPKLAAILTGDDPGSRSYLRGIRTFCEEWSIEYQDYECRTEMALIEQIDWLNRSETDGIIVMYPTGFGDRDTVYMNRVDPAKDVEGLHYSHLGFLVQFEKFRDPQRLRKLVIPPTPKGILYLFKRNDELFTGLTGRTSPGPGEPETSPFALEGKHVTIINDSLAVGRSLALMLQNENASVKICHEYTPFDDILKHVRLSDVIVSAVPSASFTIPTGSVPESAIVVDLSFVGNFTYPDIIDRVFRIAPRWDLMPKGDRINDMTLYRLISNLFYLIDSRLPERILRELQEPADGTP